MPLVQTAFTAGEISPAMYGRTDFQKYQTAAKKLLNFICLPQGGVQNRPGLLFINEVKDSAKLHRLIPFQFSVEQAYALEFGDTTMRIYKDGGIVLDLAIPVEVVTPYASADLAAISYTQNVDVLYLFHPDYYPRRLSRTSHTAWTLELAPFTDGPYKTQTLAELAITITPAARSGNNIAITASSNLFVAAHVGTPIRLGHLNPNDTEETIWGYGVFDQVTDGQNARLDIVNPFGFEYLSNPSFEVGLGFWGDYSTGISVLTYDAVNKAAVLTLEASGDAEIRQEIGVTPNETCILTIEIQQDDTDTLGNDPLDTVNASTTVTVNHTAHGLVTGNQIALAGVPGAVNGIPAVELNTTHAITKVDDDSYTITVTTPATSTASGGGAAVTAQRPLGAVRIAVGTTNGGNEVFGWQSETTVGVKSYTITPTVSTVYISVDNTGGSSGNRALIAEVTYARQQLGTSDWRLAAWTSDNGYPSVATFSEQRLVVGDTYEQPLNLWMTKPASEDFGFSTPSADDDGINAPLSSQQQNGLGWLRMLGDLVIGGKGAEYRITSSNSGAITPTNLIVKERGYFGSTDLPAIVVGNELIFVGRVGGEVRTLHYDEVSGNQGIDISRLARHLLDGFSISAWTVARTPCLNIWAVRSDGKILTITYLKEEEVIAWTQHETDGTVESVCSIPGDTNDEVYFIVNRTIGGVTKRYVEKLMPRITDEDTFDFFFVDSGLTYSGTPETIFSGLDHLEGKEVVILADGAVIEGKVVTGGSVTIGRASTLVHIGLPYNSDLETLNLEYVGDRGSSQGKHKQIGSVNLNFEKARGCFVGKDENSLDEIKFSDPAYGQAPTPLFTGIKEIRPNFGAKKEQTVFIRQSYPLPITILNLIIDLQVNDR